VSPWIFGFTAVTALAWSARIVAILIVLAVGSLYPRTSRRATAACADRRAFAESK
jgi:hypothetical protein